jgi:hypothetical protein
VKPAIKHFQNSGPRGLYADIGSLRRFRIVNIKLAEKFSGILQAFSIYEAYALRKSIT